MDNFQISALRLKNQQLISSKCNSAKGVVTFMGAMQAQDNNMVKWAIGQRWPGSVEQQIDTAIDKGEIIRTHLLRPTWHYVSPDDIHWILKLTAPRIKSAMKSRDKELELTEQIYNKCNSIFEKELYEQGHSTRDELVRILTASKIKTNENRASHIFMRAELEGIICSGKQKNKKQTYALLSERAPNAKTLHPHEALAQLAQRYFISRGPATLQDFTWWSGLSAVEAKQALNSVQSNFDSETINGQVYWFTSTIDLLPTGNNVFVLPAFDEFLISYKDRTASLPKELNPKAVLINGMFRPVVIVDGQVVGIWNRTIKTDRVLIETKLFQPIHNVIKVEVEKAFANYAAFIDKKMEYYSENEGNK
jgi:hypothetical protein